MPRRSAIVGLAFAALTAFTPASASAETRVGLAVPLTGRMAPVGLAMKRAVDAAIAEVNASGGLFGQQLSLLVEDDGCATETGEGAARRLIAESAAVVIGHPCSNAAVAAAGPYSDAGVLYIAVSPRHPDVTRQRPAAKAAPLRLGGRDDRQGAVAAAWLQAHAPNSRMAIIHDRTGYAGRIEDSVIAVLRATGLAPVAILPIIGGKRDYEDVVLKLQSSGAQSVLFVGFPAEAEVILSAMAKHKVDSPLLGPDAMATAEFAQIAMESGRHVRVLVPVDPVWERLGDDDVAAQGLRARGAFEAWLATAQREGTLDGSALAAAFRGKRVVTPSLGELEFDLNGDLETQSFISATPNGDRWVRED